MNQSFSLSMSKFLHLLFSLVISSVKKIVWICFFITAIYIESVNGKRTLKNNGKEHCLRYKVLKVICSSPYLLFIIDMFCTGVVGLVEKLTVFQKLNHFKLQWKLIISIVIKVSKVTPLRTFSSACDIEVGTKHRLIY